ncbi:MAG: UDP-N-acetylmuramoyl-tripeptide--D-alanyl-D-alanine ligase [Clostridia bacterium]|nr:UDP-N-acetylmuramoyl-tripeptide--D-alanyl-D-alanine ligase [Clostridia bacterium]
MRLTLKEIANVCGGTLKGDDADVFGLSIDSRTIKAGELYVAIRGKALDGHDFCRSAMDRGASGCLVSRPVEAPHILCADTVEAFQAAAKSYRMNFDIPVVGITGSSGKTTTKDMTAAVLQKKYRTLKTEGNLNNQTGVPQVLCKLDTCHEAAVIEMGSNHFGEIAPLAAMVQPTVCLFTNIGDAHIEFFKDRRGTLAEKTEMIRFMKKGGAVIVNGDDPLLREIDHDISYGFGENCTVRGEQIDADGIFGTSFTAVFSGQKLRIKLPLAGRHMVQNALAAIATGARLGVDAPLMAEALEAFEPSGARAQLIKTPELTLINDCYNANPASMLAALETLTKAGGRRVAILGDMGELGREAPRFHRETALAALSLGVDVLILIGETFFACSIFGANSFKTVEEARDGLRELIQPGDTVLLKASRSMGLESLLPDLKQF